MTALPLVVAHRGASEAAPEHTLAAYRQAIVDGADGLEADVRLTADGHLVCVHDRRIERISNGTGVLSTLPLSELERMDFGSWKDDWDDFDEPDFDDADRRQVLTFERLLQLVVEADRRIELFVETKHPTRYGGLVERRLVETLRQYGLDTPRDGVTSQVSLMSFSEVALRRMRRMASRLPLVYLMERVPVVYRTGSLPRGVSVAGPSIDIVRRHPNYVRRVKESGGRVFVWTVDDPDDVELVRACGADAIITNRPHQVRLQIDG
ncbi:MAG: glycerophosphodiester phosphodiesterase family protein [Actinomycetes bacterium]